MLGFLFGLVIFAPSIAYVLLRQSSLAFGIGASCIVVLIVSLPAISHMRIGMSRVFGSLLLFLLLLASLLMKGVDSAKALLSVPLLVLMLMSAYALTHIVKVSRPANLRKTVHVLSVSLIALGLFGAITHVSPPGYGFLGRPVFPFAEPSHFALAAGPILFTSGIFLPDVLKKIMVVLVTALSLLLPSLVLVSYAVLMLATYFRITKTLTLVALFGVVFVAIVINDEFLLTYFSDRLNFTSESTNLTALAYMQGWSEAYRALTETNGLGLGFQGLGSLAPSVMSERIFELAGQYKNLEDGGFLVSKIIGEFGMVGIALVLGYLIACFRAYRNLCASMRNVGSGENAGETSRVVGYALLIAFFPEMFLRGYGYFSPGVVLFLLGLGLTRFNVSGGFVAAKPTGLTARSTS